MQLLILLLFWRISDHSGYIYNIIKTFVVLSGRCGAIFAGACAACGPLSNTTGASCLFSTCYSPSCMGWCKCSANSLFTHALRSLFIYNTYV
jgi:hypothetical protein